MAGAASSCCSEDVCCDIVCVCVCVEISQGRAEGVSGTMCVSCFHVYRLLCASPLCSGGQHENSSFIVQLLIGRSCQPSSGPRGAGEREPQVETEESVLKTMSNQLEGIQYYS